MSNDLSRFPLTMHAWSRSAALGLVLACAGCAPAKEVDLSQYLAPPGATAHTPPVQPVPELRESVQLIGMQPKGVVALFGEPTMLTSENGAQYWRYSYAGCVVDIYVYRHAAEQLEEVVHFDVREPWRPARSRGSSSCTALKARLGVLPATQHNGLPPVESH